MLREGKEEDFCHRLSPMSLTIRLRAGDNLEAASVSIRFRSSPDQGATTRSRIAVFAVVWQITFVARAY
jgi:hypothetical protein